MRKYLLIAGGIAAIAALAVWAAGRGGGVVATAGPEHAIPVQVAIAALSDTATRIRGTGSLSWKREIPLAFKVQGILSSFEVDSGDSVRKGQVLARIDPTA